MQTEQFLPLSSFGRDRSRGDGLNTKCKQCVARSTNRTRGRTQADVLERDARQTQRVEAAASKANKVLQHSTYSKYTIEADAFSELRKIADAAGWEMHEMHDGTKPDFALRPIDSTSKSWLALQLKSCSAKDPPFTFCDCDKEYDCGIVCVAPYANPARVFAYSKAFVAENQALLSGSDIRIGMRPSVWSAGEMNASTYMSFVRSELQLAIATLPVNMLSIRHFELQGPRNVQYEYCLSELALLMDPGASITQPETKNSVVDRVMNGLKVQDKSARPEAHRRGLTARICRSDLGIAYVEGDNDFYCIAHVAIQESLYLQWLIPEAELCSRGIISRKDSHGNIDRPGSGTICVHVCDRCETDEQLMRLQNIVCNGFPRAGGSSWTAKYFRCMKIPMSYSWPEGMWK